MERLNYSGSTTIFNYRKTLAYKRCTLVMMSMYHVKSIKLTLAPFPDVQAVAHAVEILPVVYSKASTAITARILFARVL
jgi:hypothetical protein